jgi:hypothetical protein
MQHSVMRIRWQLSRNWKAWEWQEAGLVCKATLIPHLFKVHKGIQESECDRMRVGDDFDELLALRWGFGVANP